MIKASESIKMNEMIETIEDRKLSVNETIEDKKLSLNEIIDDIKNLSINETTYKIIPLFNRNKELVAETFVSNEDYERVMKYKWHCSSSLLKSGNYYKYVSTSIKGKTLRLSHLILGKPENGMVVDHINNNPLDNRRENLRFATRSQNSQNKTKIITETSTSKFLGVSFDKKNKIYTCSAKGKFLKNYKSEKEAAEMYDKYVLIVFGKDAQTNNLIDYDEVKDLKVEDILPDKKEKELPLYICFTNNKYVIQITYNKQKFTSEYKTLEEAEFQLNIYLQEINKIKEKEEEDYLKQEITRNEEGQAVIYIYNKKKEKIGETIVDDNKWHELRKIRWCFKNDKAYVSGCVNGKTTTMHRYLLNAPSGVPVDHINNNGLDNRLSNLRLVSDSFNSHNRVKQTTASSKYRGVKYVNHNQLNHWHCSTRLNNVSYYLGYYDSEIKAALAFNLKSIEIFKEKACLNILNLDIKTEEKYKKEIFEKWNNKSNNKKTSKFRGVSLKKDKWLAVIHKEKKQNKIGIFDTEIEAALAYNEKALELYGETYEYFNKF
jgi:hypothetical protein